MLDGLLILTAIIGTSFLITVLGFWKKQTDEPLFEWMKHGGMMVFIELFFLLVALVSALLLAYMWNSDQQALQQTQPVDDDGLEECGVTFK
jgi:hypothetical protein